MLCAHCDTEIAHPIPLSAHLREEHNIDLNPWTAQRDHTRSADEPIEA